MSGTSDSVITNFNGSLYFILFDNYFFIDDYYSLFLL